MTLPAMPSFIKIFLESISAGDVVEGASII
jgi:hypothetical protein